MERLGLGALLLERSQNFAWYTGGADSRVDHASPFGVAGILLTRDAEYVLTTNIEATRMREEQTPDLEVVEYPWHEDRAALVRELSGGAPSARITRRGAPGTSRTRSRLCGVSSTRTR